MLGNLDQHGETEDRDARSWPGPVNPREKKG